MFSPAYWPIHYMLRPDRGFEIRPLFTTIFVDVIYTRHRPSPDSVQRSFCGGVTVSRKEAIVPKPSSGMAAMIVDENIRVKKLVLNKDKSM